MGEPASNVDGSFDNDGDDKELLRELGAALGLDDAGDHSGVDLAVPGSFSSKGSMSAFIGGVAESSAAQAATERTEASANPARKVQRAPSSPSHVESNVTGVKVTRSEKVQGDVDATPERRVSARLGPSPGAANLGANVGAGSSDDHLHNAGGVSADVQAASVLSARIPSAPGLTAAHQPVHAVQQVVPQAEAEAQANVIDAIKHLGVQNERLFNSSDALNLRISQLEAQLVSTQSESHSALKRELEALVHRASNETEGAIRHLALAQRNMGDEQARMENIHLLAMEELKQARDDLNRQMVNLESTAHQERESRVVLEQLSVRLQHLTSTLPDQQQAEALIAVTSARSEDIKQ